MNEEVIAEFEGPDAFIDEDGDPYPEKLESRLKSYKSRSGGMMLEGLEVVCGEFNPKYPD